MKKVEAIIRQEKLEELKASVGEKILTNGMTVTQVLGCGQQKGLDHPANGFTALLPKVLVSFVVDNERAEDVIDQIIEICHTDMVGDGKIFVYNIEEVVRIRTRERGKSAI